MQSCVACLFWTIGQTYLKSELLDNHTVVWCVRYLLINENRKYLLAVRWRISTHLIGIYLEAASCVPSSTVEKSRADAQHRKPILLLPRLPAPPAYPLPLRGSKPLITYAFLCVKNWRFHVFTYFCSVCTHNVSPSGFVLPCCGHCSMQEEAFFKKAPVAIVGRTQDC